MKQEFTPENKARFDKIVSKYETSASALLPVLYLAQEQFGFLTPETLIYVAGLLKIPAARAFEAASFYFLFKKKDMGKFWLQVCNNVTCSMMGSEELIKVVKEELGIGPNELSHDKMFSLSCVQCLGSCDTAPVVQVNDDYHEKLDPEKFRTLLKSLKSDPPKRRGKGEETVGTSA